MAIRKPSELSAAGMRRVLKDAQSRVAKENLQRGVAITVADKGVLVQIQPDGTRRELSKQLKPPVIITKTKFRFG
jgi:hypothetical protein